MSRRALAITLCSLLPVVAGLPACADPLRPRPREVATGGLELRHALAFNVGGRTRLGYTRPTLDATTAYVAMEVASASGNGVILAVDRESGALRWSAERPIGMPRSLPLHDGILLVAGDTVVAYDAATGTERWRYAPLATAALGVAAAANGTAYFGTDSVLHARALADGTERWQRVIVTGSPFPVFVRGVSVAGDDLVAAVSVFQTAGGRFSDLHVVMLDRATGTERWRHVESGPTELNLAWSEPAIGTEEVIVGDLGGNQLISLDRATGAVRWRWTGVQDGSAGPLEPGVIVGDTLFAGSADRRAFALDRRTGTETWGRVMGGSVASIAPCGSRVLVSQLSVDVLDRASGAVLGRNVLQSQSRPDLYVVSRFATDGAEAWFATEGFLIAVRCPAD